MRSNFLLLIALISLFQASRVLGAEAVVSPRSSSAPLLPIESMAVMGDVGHTQLVIRLPEKTFYSVDSSSDTHQVLNLTLDNINPQFTIPPLDLNNSAIQHIQYNMTNQDQLELTLTLAPAVDVQGLRMKDGELILDVGMGNIPYVASKVEQPQPSGPYQPLIKTPEPLTPMETAQNNYTEALALLNQNNTASAILLLQTILTEHPDFEEARVMLAETYLNENRPRAALNLLNALNAPSYVDLSAHPLYYTVLAEAYRQTGDIHNAGDIYQQLLKINPNNATWWAGMGMCLEALHQGKAAHEAYVKADSLGSLPVPLQLYVSTQLTRNS